MLPIVFLPSAVLALTEIIGTVVVTTLAARATSDLYDRVMGGGDAPSSTGDAQ